MRRRLLALIVVVLLLVIGGLTLTFLPSRPAASAPVPGRPAPDLSLKTPDGRTVSLNEDRGRIVLVNFWATWCVPCGTEMPSIERVFRAHRSGLTVLAVDKQEPASDVRSFARSHGLTFTTLLDPAGSMFQRYRVVVQPESFWIDRSGVIRAVHYGPMSVSYMNKEFRHLAA